jgi:hypothetical protein
VQCAARRSPETTRKTARHQRRRRPGTTASGRNGPRWPA